MADLRDKLRDRQPARRRPAAAGARKKPVAASQALDFNPRLLLIAAAVAGLAAFLAVVYLVDISAGIAGKGIKRAVWVAQASLPARHEIAASDVAIREVPQNFLATGYLTKTDSPVGKITLAPLARGEVLLGIRVADPGAQTGITPKLHGDEQAFLFVPQGAPDIGLARPDDHADLIATLPESANSRRLISTQVLQDVRVLSVGNRFSSNASASGDPQTDGGAVTLAVPADQVPLLTILQQDGNLHLTLRAPGDTTQVTPRIPLKALESLVMGQVPRPKAIVVPHPHPVVVHDTRIIYRPVRPRPVRPRPQMPTIQIYNGAHLNN